MTDIEVTEERLTEYKRALEAAGIRGRDQRRRLRRYERQLLSQPPWWKGPLTVVSILAAIPVGFWLLIQLNDHVWVQLGRGDQAVLVEVVLGVAAAASGFAAYRIYDHVGDNEPLRKIMRWLIAGAVTLGVGIFFIDSERRSTSRLISDYCSYGAVSDAQLAGCKSHVTFKDVDRRDTPAARFAKDGSSGAECGPGSGPFCEQVLNHRYLEEQEPPPGQ